MTFEIEINGRTRSVAVEKAGAEAHRFRILVDGVPHLVDAVQVEDDTVSLILPDRAQASYEVGFAETAVPGGLAVYLHGGTLHATVNGRRSRRAAEAAGSGEQRIVAPMPGKILRVLAQPGDSVRPRQPLVVIEAMKMENELSSPRGGRVRDVAAQVGSSVEAGRLLVIVE